MRLALSIVASACLTACPGDDGGGGGTTVSTTSMPPTTGDATMAADDDGGMMTTGGPPASTGAVDDSESGTPPPGSTDSGGGLSGFLDDDGPQCDTNVQGEWNACVNEMGQVQTTLCNYMGDSDANGFIGCLTSGEMEGANTCFINGCVDVCDCFPPPATG